MVMNQMSEGYDNETKLVDNVHTYIEIGLTISPHENNAFVKHLILPLAY